MSCRAVEELNIRGLGIETQKAHIRNVMHFAAFLERPPDTATPEELHAYNLAAFLLKCHMRCEEMKRYMQFHRKARKLPIVLSAE